MMQEGGLTGKIRGHNQCSYFSLTSLSLLFSEIHWLVRYFFEIFLVGKASVSLSQWVCLAQKSLRIARKGYFESRVARGIKSSKRYQWVSRESKLSWVSWVFRVSMVSRISRVSMVSKVSRGNLRYNEVSQCIKSFKRVKMC